MILVQNLLWHGRQKKIELPLRDDRRLMKLVFGEGEPGCQPGRPERRQDDRLLLLLLGAAMSRLLQDDEED
jgi:hypothetical protein